VGALVSRPTYIGGLGFRSEVGTWAGCTTRWRISSLDPVHRKFNPQLPDLPPALRLDGKFLSCRLSHDEVRLRQSARS